MYLLALIAALPSLSFAHPGHSHSDVSHLPHNLIKRHVQPASHPVHELFAKRATTYPTQDVAGPTPKPEWVAAYKAAKAAGLLPDLPVATYVADGIPTYPASAKATTPDQNGLCSWTSSKCNATDDIISVPDGMVGISFDDGPQPPSTALLAFLKQQGLGAMHFMIGSRIVDNPDVFDATVAGGGALACHTWSHPYMTTMNDTAVLGELGWTLQIIYDRSKRLPAFWRPPYGDVDHRVRAIAKHVFGLTTVIWNHDTNDWCLADTTPGKSACGVGNGPQSSADLDAELQNLFSLPKNPGLVILEHEHQTRAVAGFIKNFPTLTAKGWKACQLADCLGLPWYQNAQNDNSTATPLGSSGVANAASHGGTAVAANANVTSSNAKTGNSTTGSSGTTPSSSSSSSSSAPSSSASSANRTSSADTSRAPLLTFGGLAAVGLWSLV